MRHYKNRQGKKKQGTVIVVGIDPGYESMGFAVLQVPTGEESQNPSGQKKDEKGRGEGRAARPDVAKGQSPSSKNEASPITYPPLLKGRVDLKEILVREKGVISTDKDWDFPKRLHVIYDDLKKILNGIEQTTDEELKFAAIEKLYFAKNHKTAMKVSEARGVATLALVSSGYRVVEYTPLEIKRAVTGSGAADKRVVRQMLARLLPSVGYISEDNAGDALAAALCQILSF